ncbi:MAG: alpha/beta fold hydrolase [Desulfobacteraceae bacterium]|nr:MAG: alpha/beta fold hydrolase [Desulfobacteraceae bacterium]
MQYGETRMDVLTARDGKKLDVHLWEPESPRMILMGVHGGMAHAGDFVTPAQYFKRMGILTAAYDLRGHKRPKVHIHRFEDLVLDTLAFYSWIRERFPRLPLFYMGHSVGGLIGTHLGLDFGKEVEGINGFIFSAPYYANAIKAGPFGIPMVKLLSRIWPGLTIPNPDFTHLLTHDSIITARHRQDALDGVRARKASMRFGAELFRAQDHVTSSIHQWSRPLLVFVSGQDHVADSDVTRRLLRRIDPAVVRRVFHPENFHENYNETNRTDTYRQMLVWMDQVSGGG